MKTILTLTAFLAVFSLMADFRIAEKGKGKCIIIYGDNAPLKSPKRGIAPNIVPGELQKYLKKITGATLPIYKESQAPKGRPAIYVGDTKAARKAGIDISKMGNREYRILTKNDNALYLAARTQTAARYALYAFLEKKLGVLYLSPEAEKIPVKKSVSISKMDFKWTPPFHSNYNYHRYFRAVTGNAGKNLVSSYEMKNRSDELRQDQAFDRHFSYKTGNCHSFFRYVPPKKYFKTNPEFYGMHGDGKRYVLPIGQLCLTNKEMRKVVINQMIAWIKEDRKAHPVNYPLVYDLSQEDNSNYICLCPECKKVTAKYGGEAGLMLEFVNDVARNVGKLYPDIMVKTFAYVSTEKAVKGIKPEKNVIVWVCDLYSTSNRFLPLSHPANKHRLAILKGWLDICDHVSLWDYWNMGGGARPEVLIDPIASDIKLFHKLGVKYIMNEAEIGEGGFGLRPQSFIWLQYYVSYKLMEDPKRDLEGIVREYMDAYYGKSAPAMKKYLAYLRHTLKTNPPSMADIGYTNFPYATGEFLTKCRSYCMEALKKAENKEIAQRVKNELNIIDHALLRLMGKEKVKGFTIASLSGEYQKNMASYVDSTRLLADAKVRENAKKAIADEVASFSFKFLDIPKEYASYNPLDLKYFSYPSFPYGYGDCKRGKDPVSDMKFSLMYLPDNQKKHRLPWTMGVYDFKAKKGISRKISQVPGDEKYHWYKIGNAKLNESSKIWMPGSWHMGVYLKDAYMVADGVPEEKNPNYFDVWVSLRFQGPAYVKGSQKPNGVYLDRIFLARKNPKAKK